MTDWIEHFREATFGMNVSHVWRGYGSALGFELGNLTSTSRRDGGQGNPQGEVSFMIEWSWRIEDTRSIVCGSFSEEALWQPTFNRLVGQKVVGLSTFGRIPEILLSLSGDLHVASLMTAEGDPAWTLLDFREQAIISLSCRSGLLSVDG